MKIKFGLEYPTMSYIARICGGELYNLTDLGDYAPSYLCTDSREADENTVFVAMKGERTDGHDYIQRAIEQKCRAVICERIPDGIHTDKAIFAVVSDSVKSLGALTCAYREQKPLPTLAITGSYGKTTTKELASKILSHKSKSYSTKGNFNSVIGMPLSLLEAESDCESAVFEMGMSGFGEISSMSLTARPKVAIITNVGSSHLEYLGTRENIARAKLEIADGLEKGGYLVLNGDEPLLRKISPNNKNCKILYFGIKNAESCQAYAKNIRVNGNGTEFDLHFDGKIYKDLRINLIGEHFVYNASFAAIGSLLLGADVCDLKEGLASYYPTGYRNNLERINGITVLADCYNSAPESVKGAVNTLALLKAEGKRVALLGDMLELGEQTKSLHFELGRYLVGKIDCLYTVGTLAEEIARGAIEGGFDKDNVFSQTESDDITDFTIQIKNNLNSGDAILIKASRGMKFERFIEALK